MADKNKGLYQKYVVQRLDGKPVGECIVLEFQDPIAWPALSAWAESMATAGYETVADDVRRLLDAEIVTCDE